MDNCSNPDCIGGCLFTRVGGMVFPTNRKCPTCQGGTRKLRAKTHPVFVIANIQCAVCGAGMVWNPRGWNGDPPLNIMTTHWKASCEKCEVEVEIPIKFTYCTISQDLQT